MKSNELFRASGIMALGTIISRITGFVRGILIVAVLGTTLLADTYNVANTMPNILYNLLVGGLLSGTMYSLVALGFVLIYKASSTFNFAQGAMVFFAVLSFCGFMEYGMPFGVAFFAVVLLMILVGL